MANYITTSGFIDLNGSMEASNDNVDSYASDTLGAGNVRNTGGSGLDFNISFGTSPPRTYHINANANGNGFIGSANNNGPGAAEETWTATASTGESVANETSPKQSAY